MVLDFQRVHEQFMTSAPGGYDCILQDGKLYTRDGRRIPNEVTEQELQRIHVPSHLTYLLHAEQPEPEVEFDFGDLGMDELEPDEEDYVTETRHRGIFVQERVVAGAKKRKR